jgi:hypothetical protein
MRYFWLLFTAFNLFAAAIYPLYSAIVRGLDWQGVIEGLPPATKNTTVMAESSSNE